MPIAQLQIPQQKNTAIDYLLAGQQATQTAIAKQRNAAAMKMQELEFKQKVANQEFIARAVGAMEIPEDAPGVANAIAAILGPDKLPEIQQRMGRLLQGLDNDPEIRQLQFTKRIKTATAAMWDL